MEMPAEIGPHPRGIRSAVKSEFHGAGITQINGRKKAQKTQKCPQGKQNEKDENILYRGRYVEPDRISSEEANTSHKVIYCAATLDPQINAD